MSPRVVVTDRLQVDPVAALPAAHVTQAEPAALADALATAEALVCLLTTRVDAALLDRAPRLRVVANVAVGVDNIDVAAATARGICVTNTPDVLTEATADLAFALLLAAARRLGEGERLVRGGGWRGWDMGLLLGADVWGQTLGVIGFGRIGQAMARRGRGFGMTVLYAQPRSIDTDLGAHVPVDELLGRADFVSLHCPLTAATRHVIDEAAIARMRPTAILVNTARGACVDEAALAAALTEGRLAGAGLDVFADEPRIDPALLACPRAVLAPHLGSATTTARRRMADLALGAARAVLADERPPNLVNPAVWPVRRRA